MLLNVALHGLEEAAGVRYQTAGSDVPGRRSGHPRSLVRYADDLSRCATAGSRPNRSRPGSPSGWRPGVLPSTRTRRRSSTSTRGSISWGSTSAATPTASCSSSPARRPSSGSGNGSRAEMRALRGANADRGDPQRSTRSSGAGRPTTGRWCPERCSTRWTTTCGSSPTSGPRARHRTSRSAGSSTGTSAGSTRPGGTGGCSATATAAPTSRFSWTKIVRQRMVTGTASPDDPALAEYWAERRRKAGPRWTASTLRLLTRQHGRCPLCGELLLHADHPPQTPRSEWERGSASPARRCQPAHRQDGRPGTPDDDRTRLVHTHCRAGFNHAADSRTPALLHA